MGIHMWDVTFEQYNPGLGIVSELEEIHTYVFQKPWSLTTSVLVDSRYNMLLLSQYHIFEIVYPGTLPTVVASEVLSNNGSYTFGSYSKLFSRIYICNDIPMYTCRCWLGHFNFGPQMFQHVNSHDGPKYS